MDEVWKTVKGHENYAVSDQGNVRSKPRVILKKTKYGTVMEQRHRGGLLLPREDRYGYQVIRFHSKTDDGVKAQVHRMVAEAFLEHEDGKDYIIHKNYDKKDNRAVNLQYVTHDECVLHWWLHDQEYEEE